MGVCCYQCLKYMVMIFNLLYLLLGGALLGTALWMYLDGANMAPVTTDIEGYNYVLYFLMAVGGVMFIMGFLGCCGAFQESQCMLATFFALVLVLFAGQIAAGIWLKSNEGRFTSLAESSLASSIQHDYGFAEMKTSAFDVIQRELKCCGAISPSDWAESRYNGADEKGAGMEIGVSGVLGTYKVPPSCCVSEDETVCELAREVPLAGHLPGTIHSEGCSKRMIQLIHKHSYEVLGVVAAIVLIEVLAMIFSMVLCCTVRRIDHVKA
ncbi:tetraspanin-1-like [Macrobrachium rosenbergii]|uniref:tetraspanin-1-like n=1 Tax=Macrobrachium rosenbergii TaxID=79674 RepID=UPI0034D5D8F2